MQAASTAALPLKGSHNNYEDCATVLEFGMTVQYG